MARRIALASTTAVALVLTTTAGALATRTVKVPSQISIHEQGLAFKGRVTADNGACAQDRTVTLFRRFSDGSSQPLGSDTTGSGGHWRIQVSGSAGISMARFFAKARRREEGTAGTIYVCERARSKTVSFH